MAPKHMQEDGFTYLALLFFVAIMGAMLAATGMAWSVSQRRERERELLFNGNEIRKAIVSYYERTPGSVKRYPNSLEDLLKDNRHLATVRHLRRLYIDPMTSKAEWGIVRAPDGGIKGVYSLSNERMIKKENFQLINAGFEKAENYGDWKFVCEPPTPIGKVRN